MNEPALAETIRAWATQRRVDRAHLERWLKLDETSAAALLEAARALRLRVGQLHEALTMVEEIALVEGETVGAVLARPALKRILEGAGSAPARAHSFIEALRAMRFPRLARALERMRAEVAALGLPRTVAVVPPRDLASDELRIEIRARSVAELGESIEALRRCARGLERIVEMLGGEGSEPDEL